MRKLYLFLLSLIVGTNLLFAQAIEKTVEDRLNEYFNSYTSASAKIKQPTLQSVEIDFDESNSPYRLQKVLLISPFYPKLLSLFIIR